MGGYSAVRWLFRTILRFGFGLTVIGGQHIPPRGPLVLAANHRSDIDPVVVAAAVPRRCTFLTAAELLTRPVLGRLIRPFRVIPIRRAQFDRRAIEECLTRLEHGEALVIFPEGTISAEGRLLPAQDGMAFVAARARVPILPMGISGTREVWPSGARWPRRGTVTVRVGEPIVPEAAPSRREQSALTARVMEVIRRLADRERFPCRG